VGGGLSLQGAIDVFPDKPWKFSASINQSGLTESTELTDFELYMGYFNKRNEFAMGWRSLINSEGDTLDGSFVGLNFWF